MDSHVLNIDYYHFVVQDASAARLNGGPWEGTGHVMWIEDGQLNTLNLFA